MSVALVSDVGGTNTRVALSRDGAVDADTVRRFRNSQYDGLSEIYTAFLSDHDAQCDGACIAMAGPVMDGVGQLTNLGWRYDRNALADCTGAGTTSILNDLQAQGHAIPALPGDSLIPMIPGPDGEDHNAKLVIGVGTGFNAVPVFRTETGRYVPPCESGHATFPVVSADDWSLAQHVAPHHGFPGVEDVLSGRGIERVYDWASGGTQKTSTEVMDAIAEGSDPAAQKTAEAFSRALGRVAGDLALTHLPFGGVYLVGGMASAMRPYLSRFGFDEAFRSKGRFSEFMSRFAVWGVEDDYAALLGCARHIDGLLKQQAG